MWVAIQTVDEDDVDESTTDGCIDLCETITTDLWSVRGCLERVRFKLKSLLYGRRVAGTYHHRHANNKTKEQRRDLSSRCIYKGMKRKYYMETRIK